LVGEKCVTYDNYLGQLDDFGDDGPAFGGDDLDITRWGGPSYPPAQDTPGVAQYWLFGSAHNSSFNMAFCDGSVRTISYIIDPKIHGYLASRKDGQPIDASSY
jgi:prepilin-type processing-associated H-X9-DG protein